MAVNDTDKAIRVTTNTSDSSLFIRGEGKQAFDAACFHYSTYRALTKFLGMVIPCGSMTNMMLICSR